MEIDRAAAVAEAQRLVKEQGLSANRAAEKVAVGLNVSGRTVARWCQQAGSPLGGLSRDAGKTAGATAALQGFTPARRLALCDRLLEAVEGHLGDAERRPEPRDLQRLALAFAVASDKREHLEDQVLKLDAQADAGYWAWLLAEQERRFADRAPFASFASPVAIPDPTLYFLARGAVDEARQLEAGRQRHELEARAAAHDEDDEDEEDEDDGEDEPVAPPDVRGMSDAELMAALRAQAAELRLEMRPQVPPAPQPPPRPIRMTQEAPPPPAVEVAPPPAPEPVPESTPAAQAPAPPAPQDTPGIRWLEPLP